MTIGRIMCQPGKHLVDEQQVTISRCRQGCTFRSVACHEHGGFSYTTLALDTHVKEVAQHMDDRLLEQCVDALKKARLGLAELIVAGCTSDADMEVEMAAICAALEAAERRGL